MNEAQLRNMTIDELISAYECGHASADDVMPLIAANLCEHLDSIEREANSSLSSIQDEIRSAIDTLEDCL